MPAGDKRLGAAAWRAGQPVNADLPRRFLSVLCPARLPAGAVRRAVVNIRHKILQLCWFSGCRSGMSCRQQAEHWSFLAVPALSG